MSAERAHEAVALLEAGVQRRSGSATLLLELGNAYRAVGENANAIVAYERAIQLAPALAAAYHNIAAVLHAEGRSDDALAYARKAVQLNPTRWELEENLGNIFAHQGELDGARRAYAEAQRKRPGELRRTALDVRAALLLPPIPASTEAIREARNEFASGIRRLRASTGNLIDPITEVGVANQFYLAYHGLNNRDLLRDLAEMYRELCPALNFTASHCLDPQRSMGRPLRVGLISTYLREHTIGRYFIGLARQLRRPEFRLSVFAPAHQRDAFANAFREAADEYHVLASTLHALQLQLAAARLDVLLFADIGMEPITYFLSFGRYAPIQCALFGHPDTSGVSTVDYAISWQAAESEQSAHWYSEKLLLLPSTVTYASVSRPAQRPPAIDRASLGLPTNKRLFVCVQSPFKIHPDFDALAAEILQSDPHAQLVLVVSRVGAWSATLQRRLTTKLGADMNRVTFLPDLPYEKYLALLAAADVILDTPHFNGGATTLDAIAVATPIVSLGGPTLRSAQTRALFARMGITHGMCDDARQYVDAALAIASDPDLRASIANQTRQRSSIIFDDASTVPAIEAALRALIATHA